MNPCTKPIRKLSKEIKSDNFCCRNSWKSDKTTYIGTGEQYLKETMN